MECKIISQETHNSIQNGQALCNSTIFLKLYYLKKVFRKACKNDLHNFVWPKKTCFEKKLCNKESRTAVKNVEI